MRTVTVEVPESVAALIAWGGGAAKEQALDHLQVAVAEKVASVRAQPARSTPELDELEKLAYEEGAAGLGSY